MFKVESYMLQYSIDVAYKNCTTVRL